jgi:coproporphyrinogen III oxidase
MGEANLQLITSYFKDLQNSICNTLEEVDGKGKFQSDQKDLKVAVVYTRDNQWECV